MSAFPKHWTVGAAGHGANAPDPRGGYRTRPDLCPEHGHPGVTYNPWHNKTWCLCGEHVYDGDQNSRADWPGGPLHEDIT